MKIQRALLIILDSVGVGALPDAEQFGDSGTHTLKHTAEATAPFRFPALERVGLGMIDLIPGVGKGVSPQACFGKMAELSPAKDTTTGHWEMMGVPVEEPPHVYPDGFPRELIYRFEKGIGRPTLGNYPSSGTIIIEELGEEHQKIGYPIVYTSADSVFQIACHEEVVPLPKLYEFCEIARGLCDPFGIARVIARPFKGKPGEYYRTNRRRDYAMLPPRKTVLEYLHEKEIPVIGIGKIRDIFSNKGITRSYHTQSNQEGIEQIFSSLETESHGLIFVNLIDFDMHYGHRRDPVGFAQCLYDFDAALENILAELEEGDLLIISADHGCDPTHKGSDHTREYVPLLVYSPSLKKGGSLGVRKSFADVGATLAEIFGVDSPFGNSFLNDLNLS